MNILSKKEINNICGGFAFNKIVKKIKEEIKESINETSTSAAKVLLEQQQVILDKIL